MDIKLHPEVVELLTKIAPDAVEKLVNDICFAYAKGGLLRTADVVRRFQIDDVYRNVSDIVTHDFEGIAVVGKQESATLWISNPDLHDAIEENTEILVMKRKRQRGIRRIRGKDIDRSHICPPCEDDQN